MARKLERSDAKMLYCQEFKEVPEISAILTVPEKTVYRWKAEDKEQGTDWDKDRESFRRTPQARAQEIFAASINQFNELIDQMKRDGKIDSQALFAVNKSLETFERMMKGQHMYPYILMMVSELTDYLTGEQATITVKCKECSLSAEVDLLQELVPYLKAFGEAMAKKYRRN